MSETGLRGRARVAESYSLQLDFPSQLSVAVLSTFGFLLDALNDAVPSDTRSIGRIDGSLPPEPLPDAIEPVAKGPLATAWKYSSCSYYATDSGTGWCNASVGRGGLCASTTDPGGLFDLVRAVAIPIAIELAGSKGIRCIHAGAISIEGRGILLPGASGAGKSTLCRLARELGAPEGIHVLSDDLVWLVQRQDRLWLSAFPLGSGSEANLKPTRWDAPLALIAFPRITQSAGASVARLPLGAALEILLSQSASLDSGPDAWSPRFDLMVDLLERTPHLELSAGQDRPSAISCLRKALDHLDP